MRLDCEVIAVETNGDTLKVSMQGKCATDAGWRALERQTIIIANTSVTTKAFHVGRKVEIIVRTKQ